MMGMLGGSLLSIGAAASDAVADVTSGSLTRRFSPWLIIGVSGTVALILVAIVGGLQGELTFNSTTIGYGLIAGGVIVSAHVFLFTALSRGSVGVVGGLTTLAVLPPVIYDIATDMAPSRLQMIGIATILVGLIFLSRVRSDDESTTATPRSAVLMGIAAALMMGIGDVLIDRGGMDSPWTVAFMLYILTPIVAIVAIIRHRRNPARASADKISWAPVLLLFAAIGVLRAVTDVCFAVATTLGSISVVTALVTTSPLFIAPLGYFVLKERMNAVQIAGLVIATAGSVIAVLG
jgi:drug/metabolite transporter (DMT)-like permease